MTARDWMLTGAMLTFGAAGLTCWTAGGTLSMFGVLPLTLALYAFIELVERSLR